MVRWKDKTSTSGKAQAKGRAELQRQLEERLFYWRLFLEAKLQELEERRNPAGLVTKEEQVEAHLLETLLQETPPSVVKDTEPAATERHRF